MLTWQPRGHCRRRRQHAWRPARPGGCSARRPEAGRGAARSASLPTPVERHGHARAQLAWAAWGGGVGRRVCDIEQVQAQVSPGKRLHSCHPASAAVLTPAARVLALQCVCRLHRLCRLRAGQRGGNSVGPPGVDGGGDVGCCSLCQHAQPSAYAPDQLSCWAHACLLALLLAASLTRAPLARHSGDGGEKRWADEAHPPPPPACRPDVEEARAGVCCRHGRRWRARPVLSGALSPHLAGCLCLPGRPPPRLTSPGLHCRCPRR